MRHLTVLCVSLVFLIGCGPVSGEADIEIEVEEHTDALTEDGGDQLFYLTLVSAEKDYELSDFSVDGGLAGETRSELEFSHEDEDNDGTFAEGDRLVVSEPPVNLFDESTVGETVNVHVSEYQEDTWYQLSRTDWVPEN